MKKKIIVLILAVMLAVFMTGCTTTATNSGNVKSADDVKKTVGDVSTDIENVQSTMNDIDIKLG